MSKKSKVCFWAFMMLVSLWSVCFILPFVYEFGKDDWYGFPLVFTAILPFLFPVGMFSVSLID